MHATIHFGTSQSNLLVHILRSLFYFQDPIQLIPPDISLQIDPRVWATEVPRSAIPDIPIKIQLKSTTNYPHLKNGIWSRLRYNGVYN